MCQQPRLFQYIRTYAGVLMISNDSMVVCAGRPYVQKWPLMPPHAAGRGCGDDVMREGKCVGVSCLSGV